MKTTTKSAFHRGFTLIELMIVIVILGILMGTILPRLSGAQGRARDTARIADLNSIAQAMELYYDDFGSYPGITGTALCLGDDDNDGVVEGAGETASGANEALFNTFRTYFKGSSIPKPPQAGEVVALDNGSNDCNGGYLYLPLDSKGQDHNAYALLTNVEVPTKGNYDSGGSITYDTSTTIDTILAAINVGPDAMVTVEAGDPDGSSSVYVLATGS